MKIHIYQIVVIFISSVMLFIGAKEFFKRERGQTFLKFSVRVIVWGGMLLVAIYPNSTVLLAKIIGVEGNINAAILTGFLFVFLLIFKLLSAIEKIEQNISELTRRETLSHLPKQLSLDRESAIDAPPKEEDEVQ
jgi:hypothetical protein